MRGMLEDDATTRKKQMMKELQETNQRLAQEKKDRETKWKDNQENQNQSEIHRTNMSAIMTEYFDTTKSKLAPHRYVPYHFKGLREDQKADIMATREAQVVDAKQAKKDEKFEDQQWAVQNLANT